MSAAREEILQRIRGALSDVPAREHPDDVPLARDYQHHDARPRAELITLFAERLADYRAQVRRAPADQIDAAVATACRELTLTQIAVAPGIPADWLPDGIDTVVDEQLSAAELDRIDGALTGCAAAIAETGTIMLDGSPLSGRRALTLVPDRYICVVRADQIHGQVAEALAAIASAATDRRQPITLVSGPSASSDIELERVEGVHGPRRLVVLIAD